MTSSPTSRLLLGLFLPCAATALGCAHAAPPPTEETHVTPAPVTAAAPKPEPAPTPAKAPEEDLEAMLRGDILHFGFDAADLTPESRTRLAHVAQVMAAHPSISISIAGNTDERGTEEYNLALGQRRAEVARKYLVDLGVDGARIKTLSYGKEQPAESGHDEGAWAANRRDELNVHKP